VHFNQIIKDGWGNRQPDAKDSRISKESEGTCNTNIIIPWEFILTTDFMSTVLSTIALVMIFKKYQ